MHERDCGLTCGKRCAKDFLKRPSTIRSNIVDRATSACHSQPRFKYRAGAYDLESIRNIAADDGQASCRLAEASQRNVFVGRQQPAWLAGCFPSAQKQRSRAVY
ncbi:MAG TPA: hypothetical protein VNQ99_03385 [Xanthobacteraceae bacterium]|nr:hypothetical protein [Xanthobacteraceae bacterium]